MLRAMMVSCMLCWSACTTELSPAGRYSGAGGGRPVGAPEGTAPGEQDTVTAPPDDAPDETPSEPPADDAPPGDAPPHVDVSGGVAPVDVALTLARYSEGGAVHVLGVTDDLGSRLSGVDLTDALAAQTDDPLALVRDAGFDAVVAALAAGPSREIEVARLLPPVVAGAAHIAAAENYQAHADEVSLIGGASTPYLFPKIAEPTAARASVERRDGELLDYEAELCVIFDADLFDGADVAGAWTGFVLCNDLTDRAIQVRGNDFLNPESAAGYADAKGKPGYLPLGPYLVVPLDAEAFRQSISLTLSVNGETRQQAPAREMIWGPQQVVAETLEIAGEARWSYAGEPVSLTAGSSIPGNTLLVSGTPAGVVFRPPSPEFIAGALVDYFADDEARDGALPDQYVKDRYVDELLAEGAFLVPGDIVTLEGTHLGKAIVQVE